MTAACVAGPGKGAGLRREVHEGARPVRRRSRRVAVDVVGLLDAVAVSMTAMLPAAIYAPSGGLGQSQVSALQAGLVAALIFHWCLKEWGLYDASRAQDLPVFPSRLLGALALAVLAVFGLGIAAVPTGADLAIFYAGWLLSAYAVLLVNRAVARAVLMRLGATGAFDEGVAVYGAGAVARRVRAHLLDSSHRVRLVGVYDDRGGDRADADDIAISGTLDDLVADGRAGGIDRILVALPQTADQRMSEVARKLEQLPASIHVVTHIASDLIEGGPARKVSSIGTVGLLDVKHKPLSDWGPIIKRVEDVVIAALVLLAALPAMMVIALAIKLDSSGPVLFRQRRRGLNHGVIDVLKFRTMTVVEDGDALTQARRHDHRVTRVGRVLRRWSLDELPQLFNVLRGEMSLVGPRPHALLHDAAWGEMLEGYANRHQVKPGLTGLAQIRGWRGESETEEKLRGRLEQDLAYIANWSLAFDLRILAATAWAVVKGKNAY